MPTDKNDGGPAFPSPGRPSSSIHYGDRTEVTVEIPSSPGISLRDWFAGEALGGLITASEDYPGLHNAGHKERAEWSYAQADAMIEERSK
jgi:hypothetical protein